MCGINGIFAYHASAAAVDRRELIRTRDYMASRGPDGAGEWLSSDGRVGLGHRRLSIIDLSDAGAQPMATSNGRLVVSFNGEIYNYRELRRSLEARGYSFRTRSDTEVLLHLYAEKGVAMTSDLRGMFAFAIWDSDRGQVFLARDAYGIKPLYYSDDGRTVRFGSQVKALMAGHAVSHDPEPAGHVGFLLWGSVPEPFTTYREVRALPAGSTLLVDRNGVRDCVRYHSIAKIYCDAEAEASARGGERIDEPIRAALLDSVRAHLVADVPVGAFLSAGIDSGALVSLMRDAGQNDIQTVTLAFEEFRGRDEDEAPLAEDVARSYGTRHSTRIVTRSEFAADLPRILDAMDQPSIDGVNTWFVSKAARELGLKVALSGLGGDELFGGYPSFQDIPRWVGLLARPSRIPFLGKAVRGLLGKVSGSRPKLPGMLEFGGTFAGAYLLRRGLFMPWELDRALDPELVRAGIDRLSILASIDSVLKPCPRSSHAKVAVLEASLYMRNQLLRDTDWASMAHGLEVRVPLVDTVLLAQVASAQIGAVIAPGKAPLAAAPTRALPPAVTSRRKTGFTTPIAGWMKEVSEAHAGLGPEVSPTRRQAAQRAPWARRWSAVVSSHFCPPQWRMG